MEKSCGSVIYINGTTPKYLIIRCNKNGLWGFPKGHVIDGEDEIQTAIRKVREETGIIISSIKDFKTKIKYHVEMGQKTVVFFLSEVQNETVVLNNKDVSEYKWVDYQQAIIYLIFKDLKEVLRKAHNYIMEDNLKKPIKKKIIFQ